MIRYTTKLKKQIVEIAAQSSDHRKTIMHTHDISEEEMQDWERTFANAGKHDLATRRAKRRQK